MKGIELTVRFSYITNVLRFCGPIEAADLFVKYLEEREAERKSDEQKVVDVLKKFEGAYPYLSFMADKLGKKFYDFDVVEAYWIGNKLLQEFDIEDMKMMVRKLGEYGLPKSIVEKSIEHMPAGFFPHHNFNVFYIGVGNMTGSVPVTLENMENCRINWGKVKKVDDDNDSLLVEYEPLGFAGQKFFLEEPSEKQVKYLKVMLPDVKQGDFVALHWDFAPLKLTQEQHKNLVVHTLKVLEVMNRLDRSTD